MGRDSIEKIYELLDHIQVTEENEEEIEEIKDLLQEGDFISALERIQIIAGIAEDSEDDEEDDDEYEEDNEDDDKNNGTKYI